MSKKNFVSLILGTIGGILFALGMCMVMIWNMLVWGIVIGLIGIVLLLCLIPLVKGIRKNPICNFEQHIEEYYSAYPYATS